MLHVDKSEFPIKRNSKFHTSDKRWIPSGLFGLIHNIEVK